MRSTLKRLQYALLATFTIGLVGVILYGGFRPDGPWDPVQAATLATVIVAIVLLKASSEFLTTAQEGVALGLFVLVVVGATAAEAYANGDSVPRDLLEIGALGLLAAAGFVAWSHLTDRRSE